MTTTHQDFDLCLEKHAPHEFVAYVPDGDGGRAAEHAFTLRTDTLKMREDLQRLEAYSLHKELVKDDFHVQFGRMLYQAALGGDVGALFAERLTAAQADDMGLRLRARVHEGAPELMNLPWEFLHDGDGFLVTRWETPVSRLPLGIIRRDKRPLERILRMLVVVSSPLDLPEQRVLNTEREQEVILAALDKLQSRGSLDIDFCEDAALDTIQDYLSEQEYDILHFTGHGVFNEAKGRGELLLEDEQGNQQPLTNEEFAALLRGYPSLRLMVLSACQSARTANNDGYAGLSRRLLKQGVPAVLAMQYSVLDEAATLFADRFYTGLANNKPLDVALTEARLALRLGSGQALQMAKGEEGGERVDFATPVLFLNDPACVSVAQVRPEVEEVRLDRPVDWSTVSVMEKGFVGRRRELRRIRHGFTSGRQRAFIIHGLGGIGKSVLATRAATKLRKNFAGVKAVRMTATTGPEDILSELNAFLNLAGVNAFNQLIHAPQPLKAKTGAMAQILTQVPLLLIFDNFEDVLRKGQTVRGDVKRENVKREGVKRDLDEIADEALAEFFEQLVKSVVQGSRFIFTTRYDFDPARGRLTGEIEHISLGELPFPMAVQCMNNHDVLAPLPVVPLQKARLPGDLALATGEDEDDTRPQVPPLTKRELYGKLGGHPYTIDVFARRAAVTGVADVWLEIEDVEREMIEFTLLERTYAQLPPRAQTLLLRVSILEEAPPLEALQWMIGDEQDASPAIDTELKALLGWGMLARQETGRGEVVYPMHALVRDYARRQLAESAEDETALLLRAARFWELQVEQTRSLWDWLRAREYYYRAGEYQEAWHIIHDAYDYLVRWGHIELTIKLLNESIETLEGTSKATAMQRLAIIYHELGDMEIALEIHQDLLGVAEAEGDWDRISNQLHEIAMIHHGLGDFTKARSYYKKSLELDKRYGRKDGVASSLYQLALLDMDEGDLGSAKSGLEEVLKLLRDLGDERYIAACLRELGQVLWLQGNYSSAEKRVSESLMINLKIDNKQGIGHCLLILGKIYYGLEKLEEAQDALARGMEVFEAIGNRGSVADCIYWLGRVHKNEGHYEECIDKCLTAWSIWADIGAHAVQAVTAFLAKLRDELGREEFDRITNQLGWQLEFDHSGEGVKVTYHPMGERDRFKSEAMTLEQMVNMVVKNTVAVMTDVPEQREEWWEALGQLQAQARQHGDVRFAAFLGAVQQVVEGADPARVSVELEEPLAEAWRRLVEGLEQQTWERNEPEN